MRKDILFILIFLLFSSFAKASTPIANYQMDECLWNGTSGEVKDNSGNDYNGKSQIANTEVNSSVGGMLCHGGDFTHKSQSNSDDSDDDLVQLPKDVMNGLKDFTFTTWIKTNQSGKFTLLSAAQQGSKKDNEAWMLFQTINNHWRFNPYIKDNKSKHTISLDINVSDGNWHHIAITRKNESGWLFFTGDSKVCITIDGDKNNKKCSTISNSDGKLNVDGLVLGQDQDKVLGKYNNKEEFNGYMDEVKIYNSVLSDDDIQDIYNNEKNRKNYDGSSRSCNLCLIANYRMDKCSWDASTGDVIDSAGSDNNGTITGRDINTTMADTIINNAGDFDEGAVDIDDLNVSTQKEAKTTVMFWMYWDGTNSVMPFGWNKYDLWLEGGSFGFNSSNSDIYGISSDGLKNGWHHITAIFTNGDVHINKLYIDDKAKVLSKQKSNDSNNNKANVKSSARIAGWRHNNHYRFKNKIDELKIFNTELSISQIKKIYNNEKNGKNYDGNDRGANQCQPAPLPAPIFNYQMDECSWDGTKDEVKDSSDNHDHNGTIEGSPNTESNATAGGMLCRTGFFNNADSDSQAISTPDNDNLSPHVGSDGEMTLSAWIKTDRYPKDEDQSRVPIVAKGASSNWEYALYLYHDKEVGFSVWQKNGSSYGEPARGKLSLNEWHQLIGVVKKGSYVRIYLDGEKVDEETDLKGDTANGTSPLYIARRGSGNHYFHGYIDEVKIFKQALTTNQIQTLYNNEKNRKNYDGSKSVCKDCSQEAKKHYKVDAWDTFRDKNDRNISTKIVNKDFNLTIASLNETNDDYQEFNGTVCTQIEGDTHWTKSDFRDQNTTTASYNIASSMKDTNLTIVWKKDVNETCPLSNEDNETNATDDFAIRPERFKIYSPTSPLYAGEDFNISFSAKDANDKNTSDYNETRNGSFRVDANITKSSCKLGTFTMADFSFANGEKNDVNASYSDVGDLNITIKEKNGSEFAKVDTDDTPDSQRLIEQNSTILHFRPYQFSIINYTFSRNNPNANWRYMADVNDSNITLSFNVQAQNKQNETTQNFDAECAAENVGVKIDLNVTHDDANASYFEHINNTESSGYDKLLSDINFTGTINDSNFTDGNSSDIVYALNVHRVYNQVKDPRTIQVVEVNTTNTDVKNIGLSPENNSSKFYYARLYTQDLSTSKTPDTIQAKILVYDDNEIDKYVNDLNLTEELSNWYYFTPQDDAFSGNITALNVSKTTNKKSTNDDNINASIESFTKGTFTIKVKNPNENTQTHYIHLDTTPWIWYVHKNFGSDYNDSSSGDGSNCSEHPCIKYNYNKTTNNEIGVSSGSVKGVSFDVNVSKSSKGVRVLR